MKPQISQAFIALQSPLIFCLWSTDSQVHPGEKAEVQRGHVPYIGSHMSLEEALTTGPPGLLTGRAGTVL